MPVRTSSVRQSTSAMQRGGTEASRPYAHAPQEVVAEARVLQRLGTPVARMRPAEILALQRVAGNRAVAQTLRRVPAAPVRRPITRLGAGARRLQRYELLDQDVGEWKENSKEGLLGMADRSPELKAVDVLFAGWTKSRQGKDPQAKIVALKGLEASVKQWRDSQGILKTGAKPLQLLSEIDRELRKQQNVLEVTREAIANMLSKYRFQVSAKGWTPLELEGIKRSLDYQETLFERVRDVDGAAAKLGMLNMVRGGVSALESGYGKYSGKEPTLPDKIKDETDKQIVALRIEKKYGVKLDQQAGIDAIKANYPSVPAGELNKLRARDWTLEEVQDLEASLEKYAGLLGPNRNVAEFGTQPLTTFSRVEQAIDVDSPSGKLDPKTAGEAFPDRDNISVFDTRDLSYAADPSAPTAEEIRQGYKGTVGHELSHALIEEIKAGRGTMLEKFARHFRFWSGNINVSAYWRDTFGHKMNRGGDECDFYETQQAAKHDGVEPPVTQYGSTNAREDLAETMRFYTDSPGKLKDEGPERLKFVKRHIAPLLQAPRQE